MYQCYSSTFYTQYVINPKCINHPQGVTEHHCLYYRLLVATNAHITLINTHISPYLEPDKEKYICRYYVHGNFLLLKVKTVNQPRYRPRVAQRVPGS